MVAAMPEKPVYIEADSRRIWRVVENLFGNVYKYALEGTRVYLDLSVKEKDGKKTAAFSMKNISAQSLNISADELTERFIRGRCFQKYGRQRPGLVHSQKPDGAAER